MLNRFIWKSGLVAATLGAAIMTSGFGTLTGLLGQNAEHERITRHALGCQDEYAKKVLSGVCFEAATISELAGAKGSFGAVGAPDRGTLFFRPEAHCDDGDFLSVPAGYPRTEAEAHLALTTCRKWMQTNLDEALRDADKLVDAKGKVASWETSLNCVFVGGQKGRAKCNVLEDMGYLLHASQDFYSHTNWADTADGNKPVGLENPPGLGNHQIAPFISLRDYGSVPPGLISGCFVAVPESLYCKGHVKHEYLNKDKGVIDPGLGAGTTERGAVNNNFKWAVEGAVMDTRDKWALLQEKLIGQYGPLRGGAMICALRKDNPAIQCK